jgi:glycine/sarcosine N-methyltransferase
MSGFYAAIGAHYDEIFPLDDDMADFLLRALPRGRVLDLGCATGSMALHLAALGYEVHGFDLDAGMVATAQARARAAGLPATFAVRDLRDTAASGTPGSLRGAWCTGNTLVHLGGEAEIGALLRDVAVLLASINYDRVLDNSVTALPTRDTPLLTFTRTYRPAGAQLDFCTRLTLKADGHSYDHCIPLYPLRAAALESLLREAGFSDVKLSGDFTGTAWSATSYLTVAIARVP